MATTYVFFVQSKGKAFSKRRKNRDLRKCLCRKPVSTGKRNCRPAEKPKKRDARKGLLAWLPFILIFVFLLVTSKLVPVLHDPLNLIKTSVLIYDGADGAPYTFTWVATPGVLIFLAAFLGGHMQGAGMGEMLSVLKTTIINLRFTIVTIITVIATAKVMGYAGMTFDIATTAVAIGASEAGQAWLAAANATGACAGKMISPQSIAIAVGAIGVKGCDSKLLSFAVKIYVPFILIMGAIVYFGFSVLG